MEKIDYQYKEQLGGSTVVTHNGDVIVTFVDSSLGQLAFSCWRHSMLIHHARKNEVFRLQNYDTGEYLTGTLEDLV